VCVCVCVCVCVLLVHYEVRASHDTGEIVAGDQSGSHRVTLVCVCVLLIHYLEEEEEEEEEETTVSSTVTKARPNYLVRLCLLVNSTGISDS